MLYNGKFTKHAKSKKTDAAVELLNFRLDLVVRDVCGLSGLVIIEDICKGKLAPESSTDLFSFWFSSTMIQATRLTRKNIDE